ncbi:MAG: hypothetical protein ONB48_09910 [candidate division KSB1 bacterium]|nr:hypothetical protein [candidate division KSB1 bacterium]MDZ7273802.1 hypothetical protein [candidate division KSB1 bacterium]MDZ7285958.1 hypothetical protein [candidate division KSB1 bacterium]MDZ7298990.1 hypothetical protein [candidate division KSB1 bacterium]MDZ7309214.1 hypothetical protein [candidate division KSB1 bacterium]
MKTLTPCISVCLLTLGLFALPSHGQSHPEEVEHLVSEYQQARVGLALEPVKCGFPALAGLHAASRSNAAWQALWQTAGSRPSLPQSYVTADGKFRFHYTTSGPNAVSPVSTNPAGVPDFVYEAGVAAQQAHRLLVEELGMRPPPGDNGQDGAEYDFYLLELGNLYGDTNPEFTGGSGPSFIRLDNDYGPAFFSRGLDGLRVTVAHEYFHAVQLGYLYRGEDIFFFEMSSTWFEELAHPDVNDYFQYLRYWFRNPQLPLYATGNYHEYGSAIWLHYLTKRLQPGVIREFWERILREPAIAALQSVLGAGNHPLTFGQAMQEFCSWNYFTQERADTDLYYPDGEDYPRIQLKGVQTTAEDATFTGELPPLSAHYYQFVRTARSLQLLLQVGADPGRWAITAITGSPDEGFRLLTDQAMAPIMLPASTTEDTVAVVVANIGGPPAPGQAPAAEYQLQVKYGVQAQLQSVLEKPRPNPLRLSTGKVLIFPYRLAARERVQAAILREDGKVIREFNLGSRSAGFHADLAWNGRDDAGQPVGSGVYFLRFRAGALIETAKVAVIAD